jgi:hypothetical protein
MKRIHCNQDCIYEFTCPPDLLNQTLEKIKKLSYGSNLYNKITEKSNTEYDDKDNLMNNPDLKDLHIWMQECLNQVTERFFFPKFEICHSWANKAEKGEWHQEHNHPLSIISGILYLTSSKSGHTWFKYDPTKWNQMFLTYSSERFHWEKPEAGKLIFFPSLVSHGVDRNEDDEPRYTLAIDSMPKIKKWGFYKNPDKSSEKKSS